MSKLRHGESWYSRTKKELEEMDYKEKYEKALELAKQYKENGSYDTDFLDDIFPELAESEDEKIREDIIEHFQYEIEELSNKGEEYEAEIEELSKYISYLEKQKPRDYRELYEEVVNSDWFKQNYVGKSLGEEQKPAELHIDNPNIQKFDPDIKLTTSDSSACGDELLYVSNKSYNIGYRDGKREAEQKTAEWSKNDTAFLNDITDFFENKTVRLQHDLDMYAHWLKNLPERFVPQPKPEWSAEDECRREGIIQWLREYQKKFNPEYDSLSIESIESLISWLKSLKPRWKPSEEQIDAIIEALKYLPNNKDEWKILNTLVDILKKLM